MCGIAGIFRVDGEPIPPGYIEAMVAMLRHRGPDGDGAFFGPGMAFGHTRLAIIDLSAASDQPLRDEAAGLTMIFNGEIYNYIELREELKALGHTFRSSSSLIQPGLKSGYAVRSWTFSLILRLHIAKFLHNEST